MKIGEVTQVRGVWYEARVVSLLFNVDKVVRQMAAGFLKLQLKLRIISAKGNASSIIYMV